MFRKRELIFLTSLVQPSLRIRATKARCRIVLSNRALWEEKQIYAKRGSMVAVGVLNEQWKTGELLQNNKRLIGKMAFKFDGNYSPLSQRQTSNGMTKPILYHKTHTAWQKSYCMSFAMPSYFPWIHCKTHVISAPPYPWLFPCSNLSLVSQLFAFDSTF